MSWNWRKENLDLILVPMGLLIMFSYHLYLIYKYLRHPDTTVMGCENHYKRAWVKKILQLEVKDKGPAISVITANISAATSLSSISLVLSSLIGAWLASSSRNILTSSVIYGDTSQTIVSIKYISLLTCFLIAFASFVQTTRNFVLATFLLSFPNSDIPASYVEKPIIHGTNFWSVGIRALYFATALLFWIFGPIPMFVSSLIMVAVLHNLDSNSTPVYQFQQQPHKHFQMIGQGIAAVTQAFEHQERTNGRGRGRGSGTSDNNPGF